MTGTPSERIGAFAAGFGPARMTTEEAHLVRRALLDTIASPLGGLGEEPTTKAPRGGPTLPLSDAEPAAKLADCLAHAGIAADALALAAA